MNVERDNCIQAFASGARRGARSRFPLIGSARTRPRP
jgi:hypothetical protein